MANHSGGESQGLLARCCRNARCLGLEIVAACPKDSHSSHAMLQPDGDEPHVHRIGDHGPDQSG